MSQAGKLSVTPSIRFRMTSRADQGADIFCTMIKQTPLNPFPVHPFVLLLVVMYYWRVGGGLC